jgi:transposase-like protein
VQESTSTTYTRALQRAAELIGEDALAKRIGVSSGLLHHWMRGGSEVPLRAFLRAVDVIVSEPPDIESQRAKQQAEIARAMRKPDRPPSQ